MHDLKELFDEIQEELLTLDISYQKKLGLIEDIVTSSDIRFFDEHIREKLREILRIIKAELSEYKSELNVSQRIDASLIRLRGLLVSGSHEQVFEWLHNRRPNRNFDEDRDELDAILNYDGKIRDGLSKLKLILLEQEAVIHNLLNKYKSEELLKLFNLIIHSELKSYNGWWQVNPDEDIIEYGLYLNVDKASEGLIQLCSLLEDEIKIIESSEKEDRQAIEFIRFLADYVASNGINTVIFLDKSARPFSYAFLLWFKEKHVFGRPKIINMNWHHNYAIWLEIQNIGYKDNEYSDAYKKGNFKKIGDIVLRKYPNLRELFINCRGKNVLLVDDVVDRGITIKSLKEFLENVFEARNVYMYTFAKNSHLSRQDVPAFLKELEGADRVHHWVKGIRGVALIDSGNGYSTTIFTKHRRYKHQFEALKANIEASKRHIETAVRQYG